MGIFNFMSKKKEEEKAMLKSISQNTIETEKQSKAEQNRVDITDLEKEFAQETGQEKETVLGAVPGSKTEANNNINSMQNTGKNMFDNNVKSQEYEMPALPDIPELNEALKEENKGVSQPENLDFNNENNKEIIPSSEKTGYSETQNKEIASQNTNRGVAAKGINETNIWQESQPGPGIMEKAQDYETKNEDFNRDVLEKIDPTKPIFVRVTEFRKILDVIASLSNEERVTSDTLFRINEINQEKERQIDRLQTMLEEINETLVQAEQTAFEKQT